MNKKIVVAGGTGLIGKELIKLLKSNDYYIINITRNVEKSKTIIPMADGHINLIENKYLSETFEKSYAVINLSGTSVAGGLWTKKYKKLIYNSRIDTTRKIVNTIQQLTNPPKVLINASAVGYYKDQGNKIITEKSDMGNDFLANVCCDWENEALKAENICRVVLARTGIVLDKKAGALVKMVMPFKLYLGGPLGNGRQWMPWIHINDIVEMYKWAVENDRISRAVNFSSPNPVTMNEFANKIGNILHKPSFFRIPASALKILLGESSDLLLKDQKVIPQKALENGFEFKFNNLYDALKDLLTNEQ